jgi:myo-inositol-1(or 4)-monophosphatase
MNDKEIDSIAELVDCVREAGMLALGLQHFPFPLARNYKSDGSIHTEADDVVENYLLNAITRCYPNVNTISEETTQYFDPVKSYTFVVDPIDGTDIFTQGLSGWCVSVGLLNNKLRPIAGIVYAPKLDLMIFADIGMRAKCNQEEISNRVANEFSSPQSNLIVSSTIHKYVDLARYSGKIRSIGGAALHLCFPLIYPGILGTIHYGNIHIWDIAGAHAIILSHKWDIEYASGGKISYFDLIDGRSTKDGILCGSAQGINFLRTTFNKASL